MPTWFEDYTELTTDRQESVYVWMIEYILKNGEHVFSEYHGVEQDAAGVITTLLGGDNNTFNLCRTTDNRGTVCVRNEEIAALKVTMPKGKRGIYK